MSWPPRRTSLWAISAAVLVVFSLPLGAPATELRSLEPFAPFLDEVAKVNESLAAARDRILEDGSQASVGEMARAIVASIPEPERDAAAYFALGNMLYASDFELSYEMHRRARELQPDNPYTALEWAMQQHRAGDPAAALESYRIATSYDISGPVFAIYAGALVEAGELAEAVAAWNTADHPGNHTGIDFMIHAIAGEPHPSTRRSELLEAIHSGATESFPELIRLDSHFDTDWWNGGLQHEFLTQDLRLAAEILGKESHDYLDLKAYAEVMLLASDADPSGAPRETMRDVLTRAGLVLGAEPRLPTDSKVMHDLLLAAFRTGALDSAELLKLAGPLLEARGADPDAMSILVFLYSNVDVDRAARVNREGWERTRDARFGKAMLAEAIAAGTAEPNGPLVTELLERFPADAELAKMLLYWAVEDERPLEPWLVHAIKAEFRGLSVGQGMRDSYTLKGYFGLLEETLSDRPDEPTK